MKQRQRHGAAAGQVRLRLQDDLRRSQRGRARAPRPPGWASRRRAGKSSSAWPARTGILSAHRFRDLQVRSRANAEEHLRNAEARLSAGVGLRLDVTRAAMEVESASSAIIAAQALEDDVYEALGALIDLEGPFHVQEPSPTEAPAPSVDALVQRAVLERSNVRASRPRSRTAASAASCHVRAVARPGVQPHLHGLRRPVRRWQPHQLERGLRPRLCRSTTGGFRYGTLTERRAALAAAERPGAQRFPGGPQARASPRWTLRRARRGGGPPARQGGFEHSALDEPRGRRRAAPAARTRRRTSSWSATTARWRSRACSCPRHAAPIRPGCGRRAARHDGGVVVHHSAACPEQCRTPTSLRLAGRGARPSRHARRPRGATSAQARKSGRRARGRGAQRRLQEGPGRPSRRWSAHAVRIEPAGARPVCVDRSSPSCRNPRPAGGSHAVGVSVAVDARPRDAPHVGEAHGRNRGSRVASRNRRSGATGAPGSARATGSPGERVVGRGILRAHGVRPSPSLLESRRARPAGRRARSAGWASSDRSAHGPEQRHARAGGEVEASEHMTRRRSTPPTRSLPAPLHATAVGQRGERGQGGGAASDCRRNSDDRPSAPPAGSRRRLLRGGAARHADPAARPRCAPPRTARFQAAGRRSGTRTCVTGGEPQNALGVAGDLLVAGVHPLRAVGREAGR